MNIDKKSERIPQKDMSPAGRESLIEMGIKAMERGEPTMAMSHFQQAGLSEKEIQSQLAKRIDELGEESEERNKMKEDVGKMYEQNLEEARERGDKEAIKGYEQGLKWMKNREK